MPVDQYRSVLRRCLSAGVVLLLVGCASVKPPAAVQPDEPASAEVPTVDLLPLQPALQAAHPRTGNAARARTLLEAHLAARDEASRALLPYARTLLDQIIERQRLDVANVRLTQQLERSGQQLKDSQQLNEDLQRKIDALADIELGTPARPPKRSIKR
jgi:hypothetical protein